MTILSNNRLLKITLSFLDILINSNFLEGKDEGNERGKEKYDGVEFILSKM